MNINTKYDIGLTFKDNSYISRIIINIRSKEIAKGYNGEEIEFIYDLWKRVDNNEVWLGSFSEKYIDDKISKIGIL